MNNCKYRLRKLSIGLVSVGTMFMATTVSGEDVSEAPSASSTTTSSTTQSGEDQGSQAEALTAPKPVSGTETTPASQTSPSAVSAIPAEVPQKKEEKVVEVQGQAAAPKASDQVEAASPVGQAAAPTNTDQPTTPEQPSPRSRRSAEAAPQAMEAETTEVDKISVDNAKTEVTVSDEKKLVKNRDDEQRKLFDVSREVVADADGKTLNVTLTVKPKQIDKGAEVIVLLDVSKKMSKENIDTAKENIKKLVQTLTVSSSDDKPTQKARVRLITFYNKVSEPIELTVDKADTKMEEVDTAIAKVWVEAKEARNWGVDLQGAIHKARDIFNTEKKSGKRQHIILFSQGESTFSYGIKEEAKKNLKNVQVDEPVTYSNPLLPWPFYFDTTTRTHNVVKDAQQLIDFLNKFGITQFNKAVNGIAVTGNTFLGFGNLLGLKNPLDYITMADLDTKGLTELDFNYDKQVGEGYNHRTYSDRKIDSVGMKNTIAEKIKQNIKKIQPSGTSNWLEYFGLKSISEKIQNWTIDKALDNLFYRRQYQFYNHNLSAHAEAQMAQKEGIIFRSFDVTMPNSKTRWKRAADKSEVEKRNEKFDKYLEEMSEGGEFFKDVDQAEKFKDILTEVKVTESFTDKVTVEPDSWKEKSNIGTEKPSVKYTPASTNSGSLLSLFFTPSSTKESLSWTIGKEELKKAFEDRKPLTLTYKLTVDKDKFKSKLKSSPEVSDSYRSATEQVVSGKVAHKINGQGGTDKNIGDVKVTYSTEKVLKPQEKPNVPETPEEKPLIPLIPSEPSVPVPDIDEEIVIPQTPDKPLVEPMLPLQPSIPIAPTPEAPRDSEPEIGSNRELIEFTEDTQSGMSGQNPESGNETVVEDSKPSQEDEIIIGGQGQVEDIVEDSQPGMSGDNNHMDETVVEEDTKPSQEDEIIIGGQGQVEDIVEDSQPGMSGDNSHMDETVVEEDSKPDQADDHKDDEKASEDQKETTPTDDSSLPVNGNETGALNSKQVLVAKADKQLPQTGDKDEREAFFTVAALTVIGAAGLLGKKRRQDQEN